MPHGPEIPVYRLPWSSLGEDKDEESPASASSDLPNQGIPESAAIFARADLRLTAEDLKGTGVMLGVGRW